MIDLLNLSDRDLEIVINNAYAFPSDIQLQIKLNLHKMIGDKKYRFSKQHSLYRFLLNNVPSCECVENLDAINTQKQYSKLYSTISSQVTDSIFRSNLLVALSSNCFGLETFSHCLTLVEKACTGYVDRLSILKNPKVKTNEFNLALEVIDVKIHNLEEVSGLLSGEVRSEYFLILWSILKFLTKSLLHYKVSPDIFKEIAAIRVLLARPIENFCQYNKSWDRMWVTPYMIYLRSENEEFAKIINKQTLEVWDDDFTDLLNIISKTDIKEIFDASKIIQTDYVNLNANIISPYEADRNTLIWSKDITGEDKENAESFKSMSLEIIEKLCGFKTNCSFKLTDESLAFLKKEFPDVKFIELIWDGIGEKNIRTIIKYKGDYYLLFSDSNDNLFGVSQLISTGSAKLINFSKNDKDSYKVVSNFEDFEKGE